MKVADYARAVKAVEAEFEDDWTAVETMLKYGVAVDAVVDTLIPILEARRRAIWGIASLYLQATAAKHRVTAPMPKYGPLRRATVRSMVKKHYSGDTPTPANIRGLKRRCVSNLRDTGRGVIASSASTYFKEYENSGYTAVPKDDTPVENKGKPVEHEATEEEIDEIFGRYWNAKEISAPYVKDGAAVDLERERPVRKPVGWARVIQGADTCGFCITMAARAYDYILYKSEQTALRKDRGGYHPNCDCIAVPVFNTRNWEGKAQAERARKWYDEHNDEDQSWRTARGSV